MGAGGSTVFPYIGVQVKPKKGTAVFWWNLKRDGQGDPLTRHAGCSVLYGSKWSKQITIIIFDQCVGYIFKMFAIVLVMNKWVRYNAQFLKAPCIPEPENNRTASFTRL